MSLPVTSWLLGCLSVDVGPVLQREHECLDYALDYEACWDDLLCGLFTPQGNYLRLSNK